MPWPWPVVATALCVAASLLGDGALYVVLPVVYASRGLSPMQVGLVLSANRWTRLLTNQPAAELLGTRPVRVALGGALLLGGACSLVYAATTSLPLLVLARCVWGGCWSVIRLAGLLTVTDVVEAGLAQEADVGRNTGLFSGLSRMGSAVGMALGHGANTRAAPLIRPARRRRSEPAGPGANVDTNGASERLSKKWSHWYASRPSSQYAAGAHAASAQPRSSKVAVTSGPWSGSTSHGIFLAQACVCVVPADINIPVYLNGSTEPHEPALVACDARAGSVRAARACPAEVLDVRSR